METLKQDLVDCIRMLESSDIIDYNGHASIRLDENRLLINIGSCQRSCLTTADICEIDFEGNVISGNGKPPLEFHLHVGIYKVRPDVRQSFTHTQVVNVPNNDWPRVSTGLRARYLGVPATALGLTELNQ